MAGPSHDPARARLEEDRRVARVAAMFVAADFDMAPEILFRSTRGPAAEAEARQVMLAVLRRAMAKSSIQRLGAALGRDRTTVAHALNKIERACEDDPDLDLQVERLAHFVRLFVEKDRLTVAEIEARLARAAAPADPPRAVRRDPDLMGRPVPSE